MDSLRFDIYLILKVPLLEHHGPAYTGPVQDLLQSGRQLGHRVGGRLRRPAPLPAPGRRLGGGRQQHLGYIEVRGIHMDLFKEVQTEY